MYESQPRMKDVKAVYLLFKNIVNVVSETLEFKNKVLFDRLCEKKPSDGHSARFRWADLLFKLLQNL